jgi:hypothetical protein
MPTAIGARAVRTLAQSFTGSYTSIKHRASIRDQAIASDPQTSGQCIIRFLSLTCHVSSSFAIAAVRTSLAR